MTSPLRARAAHSLAVLTLVYSLLGCGAAPSLLADGSCGGQVPAAAAGAATTGSLEVHVVDERGALLTMASVQAVGPNAGYRLACVPAANTQTDGSGTARLERMKAGSYRIGAYVARGDRTLGADQVAKVEAHKATVITLSLKAL